MKTQIRNRLFSERRTAASDELMKRLKAESGFSLDEAALAQIRSRHPQARERRRWVTRASVECRAPSSPGAVSAGGAGATADPK